MYVECLPTQSWVLHFQWDESIIGKFYDGFVAVGWLAMYKFSYCGSITFERPLSSYVLCPQESHNNAWQWDFLEACSIAMSVCLHSV